MLNDADVFLKAAELIHNDEPHLLGYSCYAILFALGGSPRTRYVGLRWRYRQVIGPENEELDRRGGVVRWWNGANTKQNRNQRVIALLLSAAMAETGDL